MNDVARPDSAAIMERVIMTGDLSKLTPAERVTFYARTCESLGLNPLTRPFDYLQLSGKLTLYAKRDATDQLRKIHGVSIIDLTTQELGDVYLVKASARDRDGRTDEATGAVSIGNLKGDALANAVMKAETKAKRRVTLSICGLGWMDESELETVPDAAHVPVNMATGEVMRPTQPPIAEPRRASTGQGAGVNQETTEQVAEIRMLLTREYGDDAEQMMGDMSAFAGKDGKERRLRGWGELERASAKWVGGILRKARTACAEALEPPEPGSDA